jgi:hypothetical protein
MEFNTPTDIGNRALQHCGAGRMDPLLGFEEISRNASEVKFAYGKLRRAELRRNIWRFATRRTVIRAIDTNTRLMTPALWVQGSTYFVGSIVSDQNGNLWISNTANNTGNDPLLSLTWEPYFGPLTASLYDSGTSYFAGEIVYTAAGDGKYRVYLSLQNGNSDNPATATPWSATDVYLKNQVVTYLSVAYMSLIDLNTNNTPSAAPALFNIATTYAIGNQVGASDGVIYTSLANGNVGFDPTLDGGVHWSTAGVLNPWTRVFVGGTGSDKWLQIGGAEFPVGVGLTTLNIVYPLGSGPSTQAISRNVFRLPAGYLRMAEQNPKGTATALGGPSGIIYNDWNLEGDYLVSAEGGPISLRFVADMTDVRRMDDMFCEGLAARIGIAICDTITQSATQIGTIASEYAKFMTEARIVNAIEMGYDDPPDDTYLTVRL